jgi:hypothetical protein
MASSLYSNLDASPNASPLRLTMTRSPRLPMSMNSTSLSASNLFTAPLDLLSNEGPEMDAYREFTSTTPFRGEIPNDIFKGDGMGMGMDWSYGNGSRAMPSSLAGSLLNGSWPSSSLGGSGGLNLTMASGYSRQPDQELLSSNGHHGEASSFASFEQTQSLAVKPESTSILCGKVNHASCLYDKCNIFFAAHVLTECFETARKRSGS